jgi:hypothetical protein
LIIAVNFIGIESLRSQVGFGGDRLPAPARLIYFAASVLVLPATQICCCRLSRERPIGRRRSRHTSFPSQVSFPVVLLAHLLSRLSFTTDAIRAADRRIFGAFMVLR